LPVVCQLLAETSLCGDGVSPRRVSLPHHSTRGSWTAATGGSTCCGPGWEVQPALSAASGEDGWGVEDLVLQGFGFGAGEVACAGEELQPGGEVAGDGLGAVPGGVDGELLGGQAFRAGGVAVFEVVFDSGVDPVAAVETGGDLFGGLLGGWGDVVVGGEGLVAPSGGLLLQVEFELLDAGEGFRGGVAQGFDPADEHPQALGPGVQVGQQVGDLGDFPDGVRGGLAVQGGWGTGQAVGGEHR
jgi:hypothetical protein